MPAGVCQRVLGGLAATALAGAVVAVSAPSAGAAPTTFPPAVSPYTVPAGVCQVNIAAVSGAGGTGDTGNGGDGGAIAADFSVVAGSTLDVFVGKRGSDSGAGGAGFNTGGAGNGLGAGGGGSSGVEVSGGSVLIVAGGGGGGGGGEGSDGGVGGVGGLLSDGHGVDGSGSTHGVGGTAGDPNTQAAVGGNANTDGGGGGAGSAAGTGGGSGGGGGGGGASAVFNALGTTTNPGASTGDGSVTITPAAPGIGCDPVLKVKKVVVGTSASGFSVQVNCTRPVPPVPVSVGAQLLTEITVNNVDLPYLKDGTPDAAHGPPGWVVKSGLWQLTQDTLKGSTCTATETVTGGALLVSYACAWTPGVSDHTSPVGCPGASSGPGAQPVTVTFEGDGDTGLATVTNTFLVAAFTG